MLGWKVAAKFYNCEMQPLSAIMKNRLYFQPSSCQPNNPSRAETEDKGGEAEERLSEKKENPSSRLAAPPLHSLESVYELKLLWLLYPG